MSRRTEQVNSLLKELIGEYLTQHVEMPEGTLVTVTKVDTPPDLNNSNVYISVLPDNRKGTVLDILRKLEGKIDRNIFHKMTMKKVPRLHFRIDEQELYAQQIDAILDNLEENK